MAGDEKLEKQLVSMNKEYIGEREAVRAESRAATENACTAASNEVRDLEGRVQVMDTVIDGRFNLMNSKTDKVQVELVRQMTERVAAVNSDIAALQMAVQSIANSTPGAAPPATEGREGGGKPGYTRIKKEEMAKLDLTVFNGSDEKAKELFKPWRKDLDMALGDIWAGLDDVLEQVRESLVPITATVFEELIETHADKPASAHDDDWAMPNINRYMYRVLHKHNRGDSLSIVAQAEQGKQGSRLTDCFAARTKGTTGTHLLP